MMKDFAKILNAQWLIDPAHLRPLMERLASATPEAIAAAVAAYREPQLTVVGDVAVIECSGPITHRCSWFSMYYGSATIEGMQAQFRAALNDPAVKTIVFRVDTPGGTIDMVPEFADEIYAAREIKNIIAVSDTMIASAGTWLFRNCSKVIVPRSGQIGSIGTYFLHQDVSKMLEEWGVKLTFIYAGENKVEGNSYEALSDTARAHFQEKADMIFGWFNASVARGAGVTTKVVLDTFGQGRMFYGQTAAKLGLADQVGTYDSVIGRLQGRKRMGISAAVEPAPLAAEAIPEAPAAPASPAAATQPSADVVEPDEDGHCPEGYEKRDGQCHPVETDDAEATAAATDARAAADRDAVNIAIALSGE
ncbi:MAG: S49 family peptidase [Vicinamibacterales bacterium]